MTATKGEARSRRVNLEPCHKCGVGTGQKCVNYKGGACAPHVLRNVCGTCNRQAQECPCAPAKGTRKKKPPRRAAGDPVQRGLFDFLPGGTPLGGR